MRELDGIACRCRPAAPAARVHLACLATALLVAVATGCGGSAYAKLKSEREIPVFAELVARRATMSEDTVRLPTTRAGEPMVRVAVTKTGNPAATGPILVFVHGVFSDAETWRYVAGALGDAHTVWLVDLPGCGKSDKPPPWALAADGYGPDALGGRAYQAIGALLAAEGGCRPVVLVGHSTGALVLTRMLAAPSLRARHADVRERVAGAVLITPLDLAIEKPIPVLEYIAHLSDFDVCLGTALGVVQRRMAVGVAASYEHPGLAPREEVDRGLRIFTDAGSRHAMQAMILHATPRRGGRAVPDWPAVDRLVAQYVNIDVPVAIVCGAHDETLPASMSYRLAAEIPGATLTVIPDCKHSPHLEQPGTCAGLIGTFVRDRLRATTTTAPADGVRSDRIPSADIPRLSDRR